MNTLFVLIYDLFNIGLKSLALMTATFFDAIWKKITQGIPYYR